MFTHSLLSKKILSSVLIPLFIITTLFTGIPQSAYAQEDNLFVKPSQASSVGRGGGKSVFDDVARGFVNLTVCEGGSLSKKLKEAAKETTIAAGAAGISELLDGSKLAETVNGWFESDNGSMEALGATLSGISTLGASAIPVVGPVLGGLLGGILGGSKKGPQVVTAPELEAKENCLDSIARMTAVDMLNQFGAQTLVWAQREFEEGNPGFVQDIHQRLASVAEGETYKFLTSDVFIEATCGLLNDDYRNLYRTIYEDSQGSIEITGGVDYTLPTEPLERSSFTAQNCGLREVFNDDEASIEDFRQGNFASGGWEAWEVYALNPLNNPFDATKNLVRLNKQKIETAQRLESEEIGYGGGFIPMRECLDPLSGRAGTLIGPRTCQDPDNENRLYEPQTITPASLVSRMVFEAASTDARQAEFVDEFNETVADFGGWMWNSITTKGLSSAKATKSPNTGFRVRAEVLTEINLITQILEVTELSRAKANIQIPSSTHSFTYNDLTDLILDFQDLLVPVGTCDSEWGSTCNENSIIDVTQFREEVIDAPRMFEAAAMCVASNANVDAIERERQALLEVEITRVPQNVITIFTQERENLVDLLERVDEAIAGDRLNTSATNAFRDELAIYSNRWREAIPRRADGSGASAEAFFQEKSLELLTYIQQLALFQRELNEAGLCSILQQNIDITVDAPVENTNSRYPQAKVSKVSWNYTDINTNLCTATLNPPTWEDEELKVVVINKNTGREVSSPILSAPKYTNLYFLIYHQENNGVELTISCNNPYGVSNVSRSVTIGHSDQGGFDGTCSDGIDNDGNGLVDRFDGACIDADGSWHQGWDETSARDVDGSEQSNTRPIITLLPDASTSQINITITEGTPLQDPGFELFDAEDGDTLSKDNVFVSIRKGSQIIGSYLWKNRTTVFWNNGNLEPGTYSISHGISDSEGLSSANALRVITITEGAPELTE